MIVRQQDGTVIEKVTGFPKAERAATANTFSVESVGSSLRRIIVKYHGAISFSKSDPVPLLTDDQTKAFSEVLARELPSLAPDQRIRFSFRDARKHNLNQMDVYTDGVYFVFYFNVLVGNPTLAMNANDPPFSEADIYELPGQTVSYALPAAVILRDPVAGSQEAKSASLAGAFALIQTQADGGQISKEEAARMRLLAEQHPQVSTEAWRLYWDKRATLKKAKEQGLFDDAAYTAQLVKLERELIP